MDRDTVPVDEPPPFHPTTTTPRVTANEIIEIRKIKHLESFIPISFFCSYATRKLFSFDMEFYPKTKGKGNFQKKK